MSRSLGRAAAKGGYDVVNFRVPNGSDTAGTIGLTASLPTDHPTSSVRTTPVPGWTVTTTTVALNPPVQDDGHTITTTVGAVTWTADPGTRVGPDQYLDLPLSLSPMPEDVDVVTFPTTQTYHDGEIVSWNEPVGADGSEPEHPAPAVTLTAAVGGDGMSVTTAARNASSGSDTAARWLGGAGLLVGALGVGVGGVAALRTRRRATERTDTSDRSGADV